jgi:hypothetical protein
MLIVTHHAETGSNLDRARRDFVEMPARALDDGVLAAMDAAIRKAVPASDVVMLAANASLYGAQPVVEDPDIAPVLAILKEPLAKAGVTHLVLASKLRHDAMLRLSNGYVGSGKLEGVGFYMDTVLRTRNADGTQRGAGFLAPFAYFRVSLVDVARGEVVGQRDVLASQTVTAGRSPSLQVWESLDGKEKARIIAGITRRESAQAVRELLSKP